MSATHNAECLWAQRSSETDEEKNIVYLTVNLPNIIGEPELDIQEQSISFKAQAGAADKGIPEHTYQFSLDLFAPIEPAATKKNLSSRYLQLILQKKEAKEEFWPRLTKEKVRLQWLKTDFSKWVDEDEQDGVPVADDSEFQGGAGGPPGMGGMGGMGGPPGAGGMDFASMMGGGGGMGGGAPGGMDLQALMAQMGGGAGGGAGGPGGAPGGMDFAKLMADMQAQGGGEGGPEEDSDDDEDPAKTADEKEVEVDKVD